VIDKELEFKNIVIGHWEHIKNSHYLVDEKLDFEQPN